MELKDRIALIIKENRMKQKELAALMGVTESYVSTLLSGRNKNLSASVAGLIEEKLGYSSQWVLAGGEQKLRRASGDPNVSEMHQKAIFKLEKMPDDQIKAVLAFIDSLEKVESAFKARNEQ